MSEVILYEADIVQIIKDHFPKSTNVEFVQYGTNEDARLRIVVKTKVGKPE